VLSTGCQWRYIPKDLPPRSTVHDYLTRWNYDGTKKAKGRKPKPRS
jgi:transposase